MTVKRYTINGSKISLPIRKSDVVSVQLVDTDLVLTTRDRVQHTLQNAALIAMSQPNFFVEYRDGRASGQQLIQQVGKTQQARVSAATVRSQDKAVPDADDAAAPYQVIVQRADGAALGVRESISAAPVLPAVQATGVPDATKAAPATASSTTAAQGSSFLAKFLGWTGMGLLAAAVVAQAQKQDEGSSDGNNTTDADGLGLVSINSVADNRTAQTVLIQQNTHSSTNSALVSGSLSKALTAHERIVFYLGPSGDERLIADTKPVGTDWTFVLNNLPEGGLTLKARIENDTATLGSWSNEWSWAVDTIAPTVTARVSSVEDNEAPILGTVASGATTNDATPLMRGFVSETLGEGETVVILDTFDGQTTTLGTATVLLNNTWEFEAVLSNASGTHILTAQVRDRAGNTGPLNFESDRYIITVDQTSAGFARPDLRTVNDDHGSITGNVPSAGFTDDTRLELIGSIAGNLNTGEQVVVYDSDTLLGIATISQDLLSWTYTADLAEGPHQLRARVEFAGSSSKGNFGSSLGFTVDTQSPVGFATLTTVLDNVGEPATVLNGGTTDDQRSLIVGLVSNLQQGEFVTLFESEVRLGRAEVTGNTWVFTPTQDYAVGLHSITARLEDAAGNVGALSDAYSFQVITA